MYKQLKWNKQKRLNYHINTAPQNSGGTFVFQGILYGISRLAISIKSSGVITPSKLQIDKFLLRVRKIDGERARVYKRMDPR